MAQIHTEDRSRRRRRVNLHWGRSRAKQTLHERDLRLRNRRRLRRRRRSASELVAGSIGHRGNWIGAATWQAWIESRARVAHIEAADCSLWSTPRKQVGGSCPGSPVKRNRSEARKLLTGLKGPQSVPGLRRHHAHSPATGAHQDHARPLLGRDRQPPQPDNSRTKTPDLMQRRSQSPDARRATEGRVGRDRRSRRRSGRERSGPRPTFRGRSGPTRPRTRSRRPKLCGGRREGVPLPVHSFRLPPANCPAWYNGVRCNQRFPLASILGLKSSPTGRCDARLSPPVPRAACRTDPNSPRRSCAKSAG